jgi:hypothetical protein
LGAANLGVADAVLLVWGLTGQLVGSSNAAEPTAVTLAAVVAVVLAAVAALGAGFDFGGFEEASTAKRLLAWT